MNESARLGARRGQLLLRRTGDKGTAVGPAVWRQVMETIMLHMTQYQEEQ
ncbi:MAG: hypothetical protein IPM39_10135 [Chloroflexi bacterium]|nr:hypothetical protein [Chloroflexota bacterium]